MNDNCTQEIATKAYKYMNTVDEAASFYRNHTPKILEISYKILISLFS